MMWYPLHSLHCVLRVQGAQQEWVKGNAYSSKVTLLSRLFSELERAGPWIAEREAEGIKTALGEEQRKEAGSPRHQSILLQTGVGLGVNVKESSAEQLLIFIVLLLLFVCGLWTVVQMLLCRVQMGGEEGAQV